MRTKQTNIIFLSEIILKLKITLGHIRLHLKGIISYIISTATLQWVKI